MGLLLTVAAFVVFLGVSSFGAPPGPLSKLECALGAVLMTALGALAASAVALWSMRATLSASARLIQSSRASLDSGLGVALRSGGAQGLLAETLSFVLVLGSWLLLFFLQGGRGVLTEHTVPLIEQLAALMPSTALGASLAALVLQRGGAVFHSASTIGSDVTLELDPGLGPGDPRNPAVISELVGDHVGRAVGRILDLFLSSTLANVVILVVAARTFAVLPEERVLSAAMVPVLVRAFGVVASMFGLMVVRTRETSQLRPSLVRGHVTALVIAVSGLASASLWLLEPRVAALFIASGTFGLLGALGGAHLSDFSDRRELGRARHLAERLRLPGAAAFCLRVGAALDRPLLPSGLFGLCLIGGFALGEQSGLPNGALFAMLTTLATLLATSSYVTALTSLGSIARTACVILRVAGGGSDDVVRRTAYLQAGGEAVGGVAQCYLALTGCLAGLGAAAGTAILVRVTPDVRAAHAATSVGYSIVVFSAALGAIIVLTYTGSVARAAARGAHDVAHEVQRQLRGFGREGGRTRVPPDHTPNYRACVELSQLHGLRGLLGPVGTAFFFPLLLGGGLAVANRFVGAAGLSTALVAFAVAGALTGLGAALTAHSIHVGLDALRSPPSAEGELPSSAPVTGPGALSGVFGSALGPTAELLAKTAAGAALAIAPFLK